FGERQILMQERSEAVKFEARSAVAPASAVADRVEASELLQPPAVDGVYYQGAAGAKYFAWQNKIGEITGRIEARKFAPYIGPQDTVLDFGCGGGHVLRNLQCGERLGAEINPAARATAIQAGIRCYE